MRFGLSHQGCGDVREVARRAQDSGYSTILFPDHIGLPDPFVLAAVAAAAARRVRVGPFVVNNGLRSVGLLARAASTLDVITGGRVELGIGAGHAATEHRAIGLPFPPAAERVARLEQTVSVLRRLFAGEIVTVEGSHVHFQDHQLAPLPPQGDQLTLVLGGNGDRLLRLAGREADVVSFTGFSHRDEGLSLSHFSKVGLTDRVHVVRKAAGDRFARLELNILIQQVIVTDHPRSAAESSDFVLSGDMTAEELLACPFVLIGSAASIEESVHELREMYGVSYLTVFSRRCAPEFDAVVGRLADGV